MSAAIFPVFQHAFAEAPELQSKPPFIYLADNLDEKTQLGWCIDTVGRGLSDKLHAHSCKPDRGDAPKNNDFRFLFDGATGRIVSQAYDNKCMALSRSKDEKIPFGLLDCSDNANQRFTYSEGKISPASNTDQCVAVAPNSRKAGPYMSRDLILASCEATDTKFTTWNTQTR